MWIEDPIYRANVLRMLRNRMGAQNRGTLMTRQQIQLLYTLSQRDERQAYCEWTVEGITDEAIVELQDK